MARGPYLKVGAAVEHRIAAVQNCHHLSPRQPKQGAKNATVTTRGPHLPFLETVTS